MAKTEKPKETITRSDDLIAQAILEGQALIAEGKTKVEAAMVIYRRLNESPQEAPRRLITKASILDGMEDRRDKPSDVNTYLRCTKHLYDFAISKGWMKTNPAEGLSKISLPNRELGFAVWEEEDLMKLGAHWPIGTRERLAMDLLLYTGVRRRM